MRERGSEKERQQNPNHDECKRKTTGNRGGRIEEDGKNCWTFEKEREEERERKRVSPKIVLVGKLKRLKLVSLSFYRIEKKEVLKMSPSSSSLSSSSTSSSYLLES